MKLFSAISDGVDWSYGVKLILIISAAALLAVVVALLVTEIVGKRKRRVVHEDAAEKTAVEEVAATVVEPEVEPEPVVVEVEPVEEYKPDDEIELTEDAVLVDEGEDTGRLQVGTMQFKVRYNRSFTAKLIQSDDVLKGRYEELKNELMRYSMKPRMSWSNESFYKGRVTHAKFAIRGKTLSLYLALEPSAYVDTKYKFEDASDVAKYAKTPMRLKLRSDRSVRWAKELIAQLAEKYGFERTEREEENFRPDYEETAPLVARKLIKLYYAGERVYIEPEPEVVEMPVPTEEIEPVPELEEIEFAEEPEPVECQPEPPLAPEEEPTPEPEPALPPEAEEEPEPALPPEPASAHEPAEKPYRHRRKNKPRAYNCRTVSTGKLNASFCDDEEVTLAKLIEKNIFPVQITYYKVLFVGEVTKSLTVVANEFSGEAKSAILNAGGTVIKI